MLGLSQQGLLALNITLCAFFIQSCQGKLYTVVEAFDSNGLSLGIAPNGSVDGTEWKASFGGHYHSSAYFYLVGTGQEVVEFWQPFECWKGGGLTMSLQMGVSINMIAETRTESGEDTLQIKLVCADWDGVVGNPMCEADSSCPSLVLLGTTQLHSRIEEGNVLGLNTLMSRWTHKTGTVLSDDFIKYYFYDFNLNGEWYAVPLVSDTRILLYNTTTFDRLGLEYPPPHGDWGVPHSDSWNWETFTNYALQIKNETGQDGWTIKPCWDEELKLAMMIGSNYRSYLYHVGTKNIKECALDHHFVDAMNKTMVPLFEANAIGPIEGWVATDTDDFTEWKSLSPDLDPLHSYPSSFAEGSPLFCCKCFDTSGVNGMAIESPGAFGHHLRQNNTEIKLAYVPGKFSFLGGSGLFIPKKATARQQDLGWELLTKLVERISDFGEIVQSPPPLESYWSLPPWNKERWAVTLEQLRASVPAQYPLASFSEFGAIEWYKPFRMMWLEMKYKGVAADTAVSRVCEIIDFVFTPVCTDEEHSHFSCQLCEFSDYDYAVSECSEIQERTVAFFKKEGNSSDCVAGYAMPSSFSIACDHVNPASDSATAVIVIAVIGLVFCLHCIIITVMSWSAPVIRAAQPLFCLLFCLGAAGMNVYPLMIVGKNSSARCTLRQGIIVFFFSLMIYSLFLKIHRIYKLLFNKRLKKIRMPNALLLQRLGFLLLIDIILFSIWMGMDRIRAKEDVKKIQLGLSTEEFISVSSQVCHLNNYFIAILWIWKVAVVGFGCYVSYETRHIQQKFSEGKHILLAIYNIAFVGVIAALLVFGVNIQKERRAIVETLVIMWCSVSSVAFVMLPKLLALRMKQESEERSIDSSNATANNNRSLEEIVRFYGKFNIS
eukprot:CAMPEP_0117822786 /NCGR_PEP_ID=MMETSP0949-20121206/3882_1 /TAXON_ID=44440 /ORGANISM="Chattonella subsalsa, Strain CCMP2191" /LENGTH=885 /DNA_ID=CAMNT_0005662221 /DNA_START=262 /DNA_END=2915 /DNA_ORIENTATION=-